MNKKDLFELLTTRTKELGRDINYYIIEVYGRYWVYEESDFEKLSVLCWRYRLGEIKIGRVVRDAPVDVFGKKLGITQAVVVCSKIWDEEYEVLKTYAEFYYYMHEARMSGILRPAPTPDRTESPEYAWELFFEEFRVAKVIKNIEALLCRLLSDIFNKYDLGEEIQRALGTTEPVVVPKYGVTQGKFLKVRKLEATEVVYEELSKYKSLFERMYAKGVDCGWRFKGTHTGLLPDRVVDEWVLVVYDWSRLDIVYHRVGKYEHSKYEVLK